MGVDEQKWRWGTRVFALVMALGALVCACSSSAGGPAAVESPPSFGAGQLGSSCQKTEDCASGFCVRVAAGGGICTLLCQTDTQCPAASNWACLGAEGTSYDVCVCKKLSDREVCSDGLDNDCNGKVDDCRLCAGQPVPVDDPANCGACGNVCRADQTCSQGSCQCTDSSLLECGACTDAQTDKYNCGACGTVCGPGQACVAGSCACPDASHADYCADWGCLDLQTDSAHCGACANACTLGQTCQAGACACPSAAPNLCAGLGCVDQASDSHNCGGCGVVCRADQLCTAGSCGCASGQTACGDACVDLQSNAANCGSCGNACPSAEACQGGACGCARFGLTVCGDSCADLSSDAAHCGSCDTACAAGEQCSGGTCVCASGLYCGGSCVGSGDLGNCGACGTACSPGQYCAKGQCVCQGAGLTLCGSSCVALGSDRDNCGACATSCPAAESCSSGSCKCPSGQTYCAASGKCVDTTSDASNCGGCGTACKASQLCQSGSCKCPSTGQLFCASAGSCVDTLSNAADCGACDKACPATEVCSAGSCKCPSTGQLFCSSANACVDTLANSANCGACDKACPAATHCASSVCTCNSAGLTLCGTSCVDLTTDKTHCGSCANACTGNFLCTAGQCRCAPPTAGPAVRVTNNTLEDSWLSAAWDGSHVGVAYAELYINNYVALYNVRFALLNPNGSVVSDTAIRTYSAGSGQGLVAGPSLAWTGSEYGVLWVETSPTNNRFVFQRLKADGSLLAAGLAVGTPGIDLPPSSNPSTAALAWSNTDASYAYAGSAGSLMFRRLGATGSPLGVPYVTTYSAFGRSALVPAPDGSWGVAFYGGAGISLTTVNAAGSTVQTPQVLVPYAATASSAPEPASTFDGLSQLIAYTDLNQRGVHLAVPGADALLFTEPTNSTSPIVTQDALLASPTGVLTLGWTYGPPNSLTSSFKLQRFSARSSAGSVSVTPLHDAIDITGTATVSHGAALVATGTNSLLGVWADSRWGGYREIYAAPVDLKSCP